jgi:tetratricopeptide (TPR) repeat protein
LASARLAGDRSEIARVLADLGQVALRRGDRRTARGRFEEALALAREVGDKGLIAGVLLRLAALAPLDGDDATARRRAQEALRLAHEVRDPRRAARALERLAVAASAPAEWGRAVRLAAALRSLPTVPVPASDDLEAGLASARAALGSDAQAQAWAAGEAMSFEQAVAYALLEDSGDA